MGRVSANAKVVGFVGVVDGVMLAVAHGHLDTVSSPDDIERWLQCMTTSHDAMDRRLAVAFSRIWLRQV